MITVDPIKDGFPFPEDEMIQLIKEITSEYDFSLLTKEMGADFEYIYDKKDTPNIEGFSIKLTLQLNEEGNVDTYINEMIIYENEDEWLAAYKRIGELNKEFD